LERGDICSNERSGLRAIKAMPRSLGVIYPKLFVGATERRITDVEELSVDTPFLARN